MSVVAAYFDESERADGNEPICVGGFLFKPSGYKKFRRYWQSHVLRFKGRQLEHFHMTDLVAGHAEYDGLAISDRLEILNHAINAIRTYTYAGISVTFDQAEFERKAPPDWPDVFGSIYTVSCTMCLESSGFWLREWGCQMNVLYVFEQGHKFQDEAHRLLSAVGQHAEARTLFRYRQHMFEPKTEVGLQAADLYSWVITKSRSIDGGPVPRSLKPFVAPILRCDKWDSFRQSVERLPHHRLLQFLSWSPREGLTGFCQTNEPPLGVSLAASVSALWVFLCAVLGYLARSGAPC